MMRTQLNRQRVGFCLGCILMASLSSQAATRFIATIRAHYAHIESNLKHCRKVAHDLPDKSSEGGTVVAYFAGPALSKITATYYGEAGKWIEEYYFWQGQLCFVLSTKAQYNQPLSVHILNTPPGTVKSSTQERSYFDHGKLIRWIGQNGKSIDIKSPVARQQEREVLSEARHLIVVSR